MLRETVNFQVSAQPSYENIGTRRNVPPLPRAVQDYLGRHLRVDFYERMDKPRYLGDLGLPLEFDPYLYRLEQVERTIRITRIREEGQRAVAAALSDLIR